MNPILAEYDDSLIGRKRKLSSYNFFTTEASSANQNLAVVVIRYALEEVLGWSEKDAIKRFDDYIIKVMKLDNVLEYIEFPTEIPYGNTKYILSLLYPQTVHVNYHDSVLSMYHRILNGEGGFPKNFFDGLRGRSRFNICLNDALKYKKTFSHVSEIYEYFDKYGKDFLSDSCLITPFEQLGIDIYECAYGITDTQPLSLLYRSIYQYNNERKKVLRKMKADKEKEKIQGTIS